MTSQQTRTIRNIEAAHEAERHNAQQAARDVAELDPRSVLIAIQVKLAEGRIDEAKAIAKAFKEGK